MMKCCHECAKKHNKYLNAQKRGYAIQLECELSGHSGLEVGWVEPSLEMIGIAKKIVAEVKKKEDADKKKWNKHQQTTKRDALLKTQAKTDADLERLDGETED